MDSTPPEIAARIDIDRAREVPPVSVTGIDVWVITAPVLSTIWNFASADPEVVRGDVAPTVPYSLHPVAGTLPGPGPHVICFDTSLPLIPFCSIHALYEIPVRIWPELFASVNVNSFAAPFILRDAVPVNRASVIERVACCGCGVGDEEGGGVGDCVGDWVAVGAGVSTDCSLVGSRVGEGVTVGEGVGVGDGDVSTPLSSSTGSVKPSTSSASTRVGASHTPVALTEPSSSV